MITSTNPAQRYKYNGVEFEESLGLDLYEMDVRSYDPAIARFNSIDPVTHFSNSTFNAFDNNPIYWSDPSGSDTASSIMEAFNKSPNKGETTWYSDGRGGLSTDPKEGQSRSVTNVTHKNGSTTTHIEYYHAGDVNGSKAGWYRRNDYIDKITPIAISLAQAMGKWNADYKGTMTHGGGLEEYYKFVLSRERVDGYFEFLNTYGSILRSRNNIKLLALAQGNINSDEFSSPFFLGAGLLRNIGKHSVKGGLSFDKYKVSRGGTRTLAQIETSTGVQRISTEFHHVFITQRVQRSLNIPNWLVNNRVNVWKLNTIQHSIMDSYRYNFLRRGLKPQVGFFKNYSWFTKF